MIFAKEDCQPGMFFVFGEIFIGMSSLLVMNFHIGIFFFLLEKRETICVYIYICRERIIEGTNSDRGASPSRR